MSETTKKPTIFEKEHPHFIEQIVLEDLKSGKYESIVTRFPPEPNGYLHIGHAKAIIANYSLAETTPGSHYNLRFDDTNPAKEEGHFVDAMIEDIKWLGFDVGDHNTFNASDYFDQLYAWAEELIEKGLAYVDEQDQATIRSQKGTMTEKGTDSPFRNRPANDNLERFREMRAGKHPDGAMVLRAKIDMKSPNILMRDPVIYRIKHMEHHRTGNKWCIYPMYDFTHCLSDAIEEVTHSLCSLEFDVNRPLYDWFIENVSTKATPHQYEFARLFLGYQVVSKRYLIRLVEEGHVAGWDDPRMPTLVALRRRGFTARGIRNFFDYISVGKKNTYIDFGLLEQFIRDDLNATTRRTTAILEPLKVTIENWPSDKVMTVEVPFHPKDEKYGVRKLKLTREIYIEQSDFLKDPPSPKKWFRLGPDRSIRLRYGPILTCKEFVENDAGDVIELKCEYVEDSFGGNKPPGAPKTKAIIHWLSCDEAEDVEVRLYDRLYTVENPLADKSRDFNEFLNPDSLKVITAKVEPYLKTLEPAVAVQFERMGYFITDSNDSQSGKPVFNRTVTLKDNWAKVKDK